MPMTDIDIDIQYLRRAADVLDEAGEHGLAAYLRELLHERQQDKLTLLKQQRNAIEASIEALESQLEEGDRHE